MKISKQTILHKNNLFKNLFTYWTLVHPHTFVQPPRNNNLSVYVSRCKQSSNQSQPIVILMLVRLNDKSVYRSFLSLSHTHAHSLSLSFLWLVPMSSSTLFRARYSTLSFHFLFFFKLSLFSPTHIKRLAKNIQDFVFFYFCRTAIYRNASVDDKTCSRDEQSHRKRDRDVLKWEMWMLEILYKSIREIKN